MTVNSYNVEFGYELLSAIPYAYWLYEEGKLTKTISGIGSEALYYFSPKHEINNKQRKWENLHDAIHNNNCDIPNIAIHKSYLDFSKFKIPDYKNHFKNDKFKFTKPIICICNRYNKEWGQAPINYFSLDCLNTMFNQLKEKYQIIYWGVDLPEYLQDSAHSMRLGDYEFIKEKHKEVLIFQDLLKENDYDWNTLQLMIFANSEKFITMNGGYSILASFFGGQNIIYSKKGEYQTKELITGAFWRYYSELSNTQIKYVDNYNLLFETIDYLFVKEIPTINILIRTSGRPNYFEDCMKSIENQSYKNINIIIGVETNDIRTFEYASKYNYRIVLYNKIEKIKIAPINNEEYGKWFPYNYYLNILGNKVGSGYIMYLDDDDYLINNNAVSIIAKEIINGNDLVFWRCLFPINRLIPSNKNWGKHPVVCDISGIGFCFSYKYARDIDWGFWKRGDFRVAKKLYNLICNKKFINFTLSGNQECPNGGNHFDKYKKDKTNKILKPNTSTHTYIKNGEEIMTIVKVIAIKTHDENIPFAEIGEVMKLEESTANVLIRKGLVKIYDEKEKEKLLKEAEEKIINTAISESKEQNEIKEEKSDCETKEFKDSYETKEIKTNFKDIPKSKGRPKKL